MNAQIALGLYCAENSAESIKKAFESGRALVKEKTLELVHLFEKSELLSEPAEQIISLFDQMLPTI